MDEKVFIVHLCQTSNLGDRILGKGFESLLKKHNINVDRLNYVTKSSSSLFKKITKFIYLPKIFSLFFYLPNFLKQKPKVVIIGGGQLLLPSLPFLLSAFYWTFVSKFIGAKVGFFAVGTEKQWGTYPKIQKILLKIVLKYASFVRLRDGHSQKVIKDLTGKVYPIVPDTAYGLKIEEKMKHSKSDIYVCPTYTEGALMYGMYSDIEEYYEAFIEKIKTKITDDEQIYIFSTDEKRDYKSMKNLYEYLTQVYSSEKVSILSIKNEETLIDTLSRARVVIGGRMHSVIISHILGAEAHTINQNKKIKNFSENMLPHDPEFISKKLEKRVEEVLYEEPNLKN